MLPSIIHHDQSGFLPKHSIATNIRKSLDVMEYCKQRKIPAVILSLDMEKCFDRIEYGAILGVLRMFNFGEQFIRWISLFYNRFEVCTQNFGFLSEWWTKTRSVNQRCPISPSNYLLIGEAFANRIRGHSGIRGIKIGDTELLLSQFADNMDLYLPYKCTVLENVLGVLTDIEKNVGLKVSYDKTILYRIGSIVNTNAKFYTKHNIHWSNEAINTLGIDLHDSSLLHKNFEVVIAKVKAVASTWYYRKLMWMGKVLIVNTLMSSLLVYRLQILPKIPDTLIEKFENIVKEFIWQGQKPKLSMSTLKSCKEHSGLGLVDLKAKHNSLIINWVKLTKTNPIISELAKFFLGNKLDVQEYWQCNLAPKDLKIIISSNNKGFWNHVLHQWCEFNYHQPQNKETVLKQFIWFNSNIRVNKMPVFYKSMYDNGIKTLDDICNENKQIMSFKELMGKFSQCISWLEYQGLLKAVPQFWFFALKSDVLIDDRKDRYEATEQNKFVSFVYKTIISENDARPAGAARVRKFLWQDFDMETYCDSFSNLYNITNITKFRNFQYRLLHNKIFCNDVLFYWRKVDSQTCNLCQRECQDIRHLLFECKAVQCVWEYVEKICNDAQIAVTINYENIFYNSIHSVKFSAINFIVLAAKFYIYKCKCSDTVPNEREFIAEVNNL